MKTSLQYGNKASKKITAEQTVILIRLIKKYRCIWDTNHQDFMNHAIRNNSFEKIGSYFKLTGKEVRMKYRRLRNCYRLELKMIRENKKKYSNLFYFDELDFLREQLEQRLAEDVSQNVSNTCLENDCNLSAIYLESVPETNHELHSLESIEFELSADDAQSNQDSKFEDSRDSKDEIIINDEQNVVEEGNNENPLEREEDEFDTFATYLASQLRQMDKLSGLETMKELQHIVSQRRINILRKNQSVL